MKNYMVSKWAIVRRNELVDVPDNIRIHKDFLAELSEEELLYSFRQLHELFYQMYTDMAVQPERFGLPLYGEAGVKYIFEGEEKWHCGCCGAPFKLHPVEEDIEHYLKLVELGRKCR